MKPDTERKKHYQAKPHKKRNDLHVHLSKDLRKSLKKKRRSILLRRDDRIRVLRGPGKGKEGKVSRIDTKTRKVYVEGITVTNAKGKENLVPLQPSNLILLSLESTKERKEMFSVEAFKKPEKKPEKPKPGKEEKPREEEKEKPKEEKRVEKPKEEEKEEKPKEGSKEKKEEKQPAEPKAVKPPETPAPKG
jgi:large subunit ribosomal protein L24